MSHRFLAEAEADYFDAIRFYENQRAGLGKALIAEFERIMALAEQRPLAWKAIGSSDIRRIDLHQFPYAVFYRFSADDGLLIAAFAHHRRHPDYWLKRIR